MRQLRINERIRVAQVRVIGEDGAQLGVMAPADALKLARERGLDLVEVAPQTTPPVCRILDFNKFRYEEQRREREAKKKHHVAKLKEVKFKPRIERHDYQIKLAMLKRFLMRGDQAKVTMVYRGRELTHTELGRRILDRLVEDLRSVSKVERTPQLEGRFMTMVFGPDREKVKQLERQAARQKAMAERAEALKMPADSVAVNQGSSPAPHQPSGANGPSLPQSS
ncbi:MAG: translation initiation factor IF-3 [Candidatus Omnitrophica bacterium]|nr:translation initiation factor IF-3 [Candidatus Omnitrophota bacterium]